MREEQGDMWEIPANCRVVTTNGIVKNNGELVMGGGCAYEATLHYPEIAEHLGYLVKKFGNHAHVLNYGGEYVMSMPTKEHYKDPSPMELIVRSAEELVTHANEFHFDRVVVPRPGCGLGGLDWKDVKKALLPIFDQRFVVVTF